MNFDFSDEQKILQGEVRRFLAERCPLNAVRAILDGREPFDRALYKGLADMGVLGVAIPEVYGGVGLTSLELCLMGEELGRALAPVPMASSIYLCAQALLLAGSDTQKQAWLPKLASGELIGTFALAETPGRVTADSIEATYAAGRLSGVKTAVSDGDVADVAVVLARSVEGVQLVLTDLSSGGVAREPLQTIDPTRSYAKLTFEQASAEALGGGSDGWRLAETLLDRAAAPMAFEQLAGAERALEMARDYALDRMAFGRQIGSFQAIKHMLAEMYVSTVLARSNCYYAAWALSTESTELPVAAATARVSATQAFQLCAKNNIQVHGGMGFTWEFDCHLFYRRSNSLALALGSQSTWERLLIQRMGAGNAPNGPPEDVYR